MVGFGGRHETTNAITRAPPRRSASSPGRWRSQAGGPGFRGFAEQCQYDLDGWTAPGLITPASTRLRPGKTRLTPTIHGWLTRGAGGACRPTVALTSSLRGAGASNDDDRDHQRE
jgi:hypothetical protein